LYFEFVGFTKRIQVRGNYYLYALIPVPISFRHKSPLPQKKPDTACLENAWSTVDYHVSGFLVWLGQV
jgi:hypothetical protein